MQIGRNGFARIERVTQSVALVEWPSLAASERALQPANNIAHNGRRKEYYN